MKKKLILLGLLLCTLPLAKLQSFCGFYVAKADSKLFNKASQVVLVRKENKTVLTMANDFQGDPKEFAVVIPVPTLITKEQIHIADKALIDHLDAYTSPRLVEYFDENPCQMIDYKKMPMPTAAPAGGTRNEQSRAKSLGVKIEAQYTVGEYDILILSASQSNGLEIWLKENGYKIPEGATDVLGSYIKQNMKFFVAKVNLKEQSKLGYSYLRPIQVAYESPKFMLPIRLGTVNSSGTQELFIYALTQGGRVETTNYRTVKIPTGMDIPLYVKDDFSNFYKAMFSEEVKKEDMKTIFTEYAWDMNWCDPCAADPLSHDELKTLGVFWLDDTTPSKPFQGGSLRLNMRSSMPPMSGAVNTFVTRLHVRYDREHFPEDLVFQETADRTNFQGRYVLRHPWEGSDTCQAAIDYRKSLPKKFEQEAQNLATLTGWNINDIRQKMKLSPKTTDERKWYKKIWN